MIVTCQQQSWDIISLNQLNGTLMNYLNLPYPHGYLVWKKTQKAIVSDKLLNDTEYLIITGQDAFCEVRLSQPSIWTIQEFDRQNEVHCHKVFERKLRWPDAKSLYTYPVRIMRRFEKPLLFVDGQAINYKPNYEQRKMITQANNLPAKIILNAEAVSVGNDGFNISELTGDDAELKRILEAVYETKVSQSNGGLSLPIYQLALVRNPRLVVKKEGE